MEQKDWYKVLGAKPSDSPAELKRKYQKLALLLGTRCMMDGCSPTLLTCSPPSLFVPVFGWQYHPDKQEAGVAAAQAEERARRFLEIHQAWKILGNEETKREYDLQQREDNLTKEWPLHEQIYLEDMSWNEDEQLYTLSCRCGGNYSVSKSESKDVSVVCCDTCSLVIQILQ
ncbi:dnaJ homolog subfamily C member 24 isoform X1 [Serinus canaria]|uniref:dnaJ homolog subfamily C member 24 isoform X1 n=1 Tax=Serinus canaria TaxID=9135 RepID=UPI0008DB65ED|nr:dnaJ homolog subfamily C member 24 isoform X1 [Serinus canaria]